MEQMRIAFSTSALKIRSVTALCFGLLPLTQLHADDLANVRPKDLRQLSLEELMDVQVATVTVASKFEQKVTEAPSSISIVTNDEIKEYGYRTLADILRSVRGLYVSYDRNYSYLGIRGFNRPGDFNARALLLVDGHRMNDNIFDSALIGTDFILDADLIERVEVIRGPSSSLYGNSAFFGVINVVTRRGHEIDGLESSFEGGSFNTYKGRITFGKKFDNDVELLISGSLMNNQGPGRLFYPDFNTPANNNGVAVSRDYDRAGNVFASLTYGDFTFESAFSSRNKGVPTASYGTLFNANEHTMDNQGFVDLKYQKTFANDFDVLARINFNHYSYDGFYPQPTSPVVINKDENLGQWVGLEFQVNKKLWDKHTLTLGAEYRENVHLDQLNFDVAPYTSYMNSRLENRTYGVFGQAEVALLDQLKLNAGLRYDQHYQFGDTINPRVGLIWQPIEPTVFKLLYGQAFRAPNAYESYYSGTGSEANLSLRPEKISTYEFVYEQKLPYRVNLSASTYYYHIKDLIDQQLDPGNGLIVYQNVRDVDALGLEFELQRRLESGFEIRVSYTLQRSVDAANHQELSSSPRHLLKGNIAIPLYQDKVMLGLEAQYNTDIWTLQGNRLGGPLLVNATLFTQKLVKGWELSASLYNVLGYRYSYLGGAEHTMDSIPQDGRSFRVKVTYRF